MHKYICCTRPSVVLCSHTLRRHVDFMLCVRTTVCVCVSRASICTKLTGRTFQLFSCIVKWFIWLECYYHKITTNNAWVDCGHQQQQHQPLATRYSVRKHTHRNKRTKRTEHPTSNIIHNFVARRQPHRTVWYLWCFCVCTLISIGDNEIY